MEFNIIRSPDKEEIKVQVLEKLHKGDFDSSIGYDDMRIKEFVYSLMKLRKMLEIANEIGVGFAAFFKGPSGRCYYISNVNYWED